MTTKNDARPRDRRSHIARLTANVPREMQRDLKVLATKREMTIRDLVNELVSNEIEEAKASE